MKKSLYHINAEFLEIREQLTDGELTPELEQSLQITETELENKAVNYAFIIKHFSDRETAIDAEMKRLSALKKTATNAITRLKTNVAGAMQLFGIEKIEHELMTLSLRKSTQCVIASDLVPEKEFENPDNPLFKFVNEKTTYSFDKTAIKDALKSGEIIDGAELIENKSLSIK